MSKVQEIINGLLPGTILYGKAYEYKIIKPLGQGSFGITYLAEIKLRGELGTINATVYVAIKEFFMREINGRDNTSVTSSSKEGLYDKYKKKFIGEARNLSKLKHDNIIKVIEAFEANNTVYYSMEFIDGGSLDDLITRRGFLTEEETISYTKQIASALSFMHSRNMLHLDIKPSNIMLRDGSAVLIDFGLSKQFDDDGNPESSTTIGGGTPGYAPLEQANFHGDTSYGLPMTMDIYALGATMFKMLVGHKPPVASDVLNDGFPAYEFNGKAVSATFVELVKKIMAPLQKERIPDAITLLAELNQFNCLNEQTIVEERTADDVKPVVGRTNKLVSFLKGNTLSMVAMLAVLIVSLRMCHNPGKNVVYDSDITDTSVSDSVLITAPYEEQADTTLIFEPPQKTSDVKPSPSYNQKPQKSNSQKRNAAIDDDDRIYDVVEQNAQFPGGDTTLIFEPPQKTSDVKPSPSYNQKPQKSNSQKRNAAIDDDDRIYDVVEQLAQFPGGDTECMKWLAENLKYPPICQKLGVQGRVVVKFVVNRDGSIVDVEIVRSPHPFLSKEAERVVKMMPKWQPARQGNKAVRSRFNLPVMFRLSTRENEIFQNAPKFAKL